jgi:hypothetical protein
MHCARYRFASIYLAQGEWSGTILLLLLLPPPPPLPPPLRFDADSLAAGGVSLRARR